MYDAALANTGDDLHIEILHLTVMKNKGERNHMKIDQLMVYP